MENNFVPLASNIYHHKHVKNRIHNRPHFLDRNRKKRTFCCVNCGLEGHVYRECKDPITSYGIIAVRRADSAVPISEKRPEKYRCEYHRANCTDSVPKELDSFTPYGDSPVYLMVQRKDTMGYVDFVRGKYPIDDPAEKMAALKTYLGEMTCEERKRLLHYDFTTLWDNMWCNKNSRLYINEYKEAQERFKLLDIKELLDTTTCRWSEQEFGFPKGRKNMTENNLDCAVREFREETGYTQNEITFSKDTWEENFTGTNGVCYRHIYYIAEIPDSVLYPKVKMSDIRQAGEIANSGWYTYEQCMQIIRPYDDAKKQLLTRVHFGMKF